MASHVPVRHHYRHDIVARFGRALISPAFLAACVACVVYLFTLAPTVFTLDSAELTLAAYTLGLAHSPGYPTYLLSLHMFQHVPIGDVGYRSNLFSALANSFSVGALTLICEQLCGRWEPAVVAALCFAFRCRFGQSRLRLKSTPFRARFSRRFFFCWNDGDAWDIRYHSS